MKVERVRPEDMQNLVPFIDRIFTEAQKPIQFVELLPKLYGPGQDTSQYHIMIRDGEKIVAALCLYPVEMDVDGCKISGASVGNVAVDPDYRNQGFMQKMMAQVAEDCKTHGYEFACLNGRRQRYENFGFTKAGNSHIFRINKRNTRNCGAKENHIVEFCPIDQDPQWLDLLFAMYESRKVKATRTRENFLLTLQSWKSDVRAILINGQLEGYFSLTNHLHNEAVIQEFHLQNLAYMPDVVTALFTLYSYDAIQLMAPEGYCPEGEYLARICEDYEFTARNNYYIAQFQNLTEACMKLAAQKRKLQDGAVSLSIAETGECITLTVQDGRPSVRPCEGDKVDLTLPRMQATQLLFTPMTPFLPGYDQFPGGWLPLPLSLQETDFI